MNKYIILTTSESSDHYSYLIESKRNLKQKDFDKWLLENANDKDEEMCYEHIDRIICVTNKNFKEII